MNTLTVGLLLLTIITVSVIVFFVFRSKETTTTTDVTKEESDDDEVQEDRDCEGAYIGPEPTCSADCGVGENTFTWKYGATKQPVGNGARCPSDIVINCPATSCMRVGPLNDTNYRGVDIISFEDSTLLTDVQAQRKCKNDPNCYAVIKADNRYYYKGPGGSIETVNWNNHTTWTK